MRQILFRGFNRKNNKWLYGYYLVNRGRWNDEIAAFVVQMKNSSQFYPLCCEYDIIGNIYENEELLEDE